MEQRGHYGASIRNDADGERAHYLDGRAVQTDLLTTCVAIPAGCSPVTSSCFFGPAAGPSPLNPGPCPKDSFTGYSFMVKPSPYIFCYSIIDKPAVASKP